MNKLFQSNLIVNVKILALAIIFLLLSGSSSFACTGFTASEGDTVLVGANKDWWDPDPYIRFYPSDENTYGRILFEFKWPVSENPEYYAILGGMNDQGLFMDTFAHPYLLPVISWYKPRFDGQLIAHCIETCSTVDEVLEIFNTYNLYFMRWYQFLVVDSTGASVIIEGDNTIYSEGQYQVVTNFLHSNPGHGGYPCWRYDTAVSMVENMTDLSMEYFTSICNSTHQENAQWPTQYSHICDLRQGIVYLYHYHNYKNVILINLSEELALGKHSYFLPSLFEPADNKAPNIPNKPVGPNSCKVKTENKYGSFSTDPNGDQVYYQFDWGDGTLSNWVTTNNALDEGNASHIWEKTGNYEIKARAKDIYGRESDWSDPLLIATGYSNCLYGAKVAVYIGPGTSYDGITAFEHFLDWKGISWEEITQLDINQKNISDLYDAICMPGGCSLDYEEYIDNLGAQHIRELVENGGGYIGICAGASYASSTRTWGEQTVQYSLKLFNGTAYDPDIKDYDMTRLNMVDSHPINAFEPPIEWMLYAMGPALSPNPNQEMDVIATYNAHYDAPASISFEFGKGKVVLIGTHPEIEEDSDRDGTDCAQQLPDYGSDWNFLWTAMDFVLGNEISKPPLKNRCPNKPAKPEGPTVGKVGTSYSYTVSTTDPDGDRVYYLFDWGDGTDTGWIGHYKSGSECNAFHVWNGKGNFEIRVISMDVNGSNNSISDWSEPLSISMPKNRQVINTYFFDFLEQLSRLFPILKNIYDI